jgi:hypothetical protein
MSDAAERSPGTARARVRQDREIAVAHSIAAAEFALAREACAVGRVLDEAGVPFDAATFVAVRILEASVDGGAEPLDCLRVLRELGVVERSVGIARALLDEAA